MLEHIHVWERKCQREFFWSDLHNISHNLALEWLGIKENHLSGGSLMICNSNVTDTEKYLSGLVLS